MKRRTFLTLPLLGLTPLLTHCNSSMDHLGSRRNLSSTLSLEPSSSILPIPELMTGTSFDLKLQKGTRQFLTDKTTDTYGINGDFLGPAIKVRNGDNISLNVTNNLSESSTLHWHGMHLPGEMDGGPHQLIQPGETWQAQYQVKQEAATNWFHPHQEGETGRQVYQGLAGLLIVEDDHINTLGLPSTWGEDDIPLIVQDRYFTADGQLSYLPSAMDGMNGMTGGTYLTNGVINATTELPAQLVRFRVLNGSNARFYELKFSDGHDFQQISTDGGLLETPQTLSQISLSPGERIELVTDLSGRTGQQLSLVDANNANKPILEMSITTPNDQPGILPEILASREHPSEADAAKTRTFELNMGGMMGGMNNNQSELFTINGQAMDMNRIDERVPINTWEIWKVNNRTGMNHNFHVHGASFYLLDRNGEFNQVAAYEKGPKDTVQVGAGDSVRFMIRFTDYTTDATAPYMFHCHILEHEDRGMMGQLIVI
ncbi:copper oxidase [Hydrogenovibrio sp. SC-1]|uniref:multicopper oxidase family protein n=1 Tax=Hydrogenovibrio sp. SC-1 TaxID=2065820 RepID=UPI000C7E66E0|nr:multicopper oxidase domain-containing protein [Hydrogenovibrio sp. SC-1]PLA74948.1 copper oxidase [Hydrogenovibrio sp. SC-1]